MTNGERTLDFRLADADKTLWRAADAGDVQRFEELVAEAAIRPEDDLDVVEASPEAMRVRLFRVLALQNAAKHRDAHGAAEALLDLPPPFALWARAERLYAARAKAELLQPEDASWLLSEAEAHEQSSDPWGRFAAARAFLALGLVTTQDNRPVEAESYLMRAETIMQAVGSQSGLAVVSMELGKLRAWQGRGDEALPGLLIGLAIWRQLNEARSSSIWHEIGQLLFDARQYREAVIVLRATFSFSRTTRTQNALARALIADGRLDEAEAVARELLETEQAQRLASPSHDPYREIMGWRDLAEIEVRRAELEQGHDPDDDSGEGLAKAASRLDSALRLMGVGRTDADPLFVRWIAPIDRAARRGRTVDIGFSQMRLVQIELLIDAARRPGEAARNLTRLAEVYALRQETAQEIEAREQAADAFVRAGESSRAVRELDLAVRLAEGRGISTTAVALRRKLAAVTGALEFSPGRAEGYIVRGLEERRPFETVLLGTEVGTGRNVRIHRFAFAASAPAAVRSDLSALADLFSRSRVLPGLPTLVGDLPKRGDDLSRLTHFDLIVERVEGQRLSRAIAEGKAATRRAIRIVRDLSATVGMLHDAGLTDVRPDPERIVLDIGDNPVLLDLIAPRSGPRPKLDDVAKLAEIAILWITGQPPRIRGLAFGSGQMRRVFGPGNRFEVTAELDDLLSQALFGGDGAALGASRFADRLQGFC